MPSTQDLAAVYEDWETTAAPALSRVISSMEYIDYPPLLQAAIIAKAPRNIIANIINRFDCIMIRDNVGNLPINVAVEQRLGWEVGMNSAAYYGLQWTNQMQELVETEITEGNTDQFASTSVSASETELQNIIIIATMGIHSDLDTIYNLLKMSPDAIASYREILGV